MMTTANRVAFNTMIQYVQLVLNVLIGLVSVRIILGSLGQCDYGIYDLIGGVIGLLSFISSSLSQTSVRFLSVSLGKKDKAGTKETFSSCFWMHLLIALGICLLLEFVGLFLFQGFLNIPSDRIDAAKVVYHCMVMTLFMNISMTPFTALIVSHESFWYTSVIGILDSLLKLGIAIVISKASGDKLAIYGVLMVLITLVNLLCYVFYCARMYKDDISCRWQGVSRLKGVGGFAGWTLLDVLGSVLNRQGYTVLLNRFFGPVVNATYAVARQLEGHVYTISASVINTMKPQIMKSHGGGDEDRMFRLSMTAGKFGFSMMSFVVIPLLVMMPDVLSLWLKDVPEGTTLFARILICACMAEQLTKGLFFANQAVGNIKWFSIIVSLTRIMALPSSFIALICGAPAYVAILLFLVFETLGSCSRIIILSKISDFKASSFVTDVMFKLAPPFILSFIICTLLYRLGSGILWMCAVALVSAATYAACVYWIGMTKEEKGSIGSIIKSVLHR